LQRARKDAADEASRDREAKIREEMVAVELSAARAEGERRAAASVEILKRTQQEEYAKAKARQAQEATVSASDRKAEAFGRMSDPEFIRQNGLDSFDKKRG
jgi:high-affinity K+ transport system ATPase subunit B